MNTVPIFLSSDDNYAPFVATTIASICDNTASFIDFYILDGGISKKNKVKICELKSKFKNFSIEFLTIDMEKEFASINYNNQGKWISISTYNRFLIPQLKPEMDKALYSDVDVIVLGDIAEMYHENLDGYALGAVWEEYCAGDINNRRKEKLGLSDNHKYFCAGTLLIDCKKWRDEKILKQLFDIDQKYKERLTYADQDVLNIYFDNNYQPLAKKYCYLAQDFYFYDKHNNIMVRHYNGQVKPWHLVPEASTSLMPNLSDFWHYAKFTDFYGDLYSHAQNTTEKGIRHLKFIKLATRIRNEQCTS